MYYHAKDNLITRYSLCLIEDNTFFLELRLVSRSVKNVLLNPPDMCPIFTLPQGDIPEFIPGISIKLSPNTLLYMVLTMIDAHSFF